MDSISARASSGNKGRRLQGIYRIMHSDSGRFYIGSTVDYAARRRLHLHCLLHGKHHSQKLQRAWTKYGSGAFVFEFLEEVAEFEDLIPREQAYLDELHPFYNVALDAVKPMLGRGGSENFMEAVRKAGERRRREFCVRGHALSGDNLYISPHGRRGCRACTNANSKRHRELAAAREGRTLELHTRDRTHCPQGHPYSGDNVKIGKHGRYCRECHRVAGRERLRRKYAEAVAAKKAAGTYKPAGWNLRELNAERARQKAEQP